MSVRRLARGRTRLRHGDGTTEVAGLGRVRRRALRGTPCPRPAAATPATRPTSDNAASWLPDSDRVVALTSNTDEIRAEELLRAIGPALVAGDPIPRPARPAPRSMPRPAATRRDVRRPARWSPSTTTACRSPPTAADAVAALFARRRRRGADDARAAVLALLAGGDRTGPGGARAPRGRPRSRSRPSSSPARSSATASCAPTSPLTGPTASSSAWYALDDEGGIEAVELTDEPPTLRVVPAARRPVPCPTTPPAPAPTSSSTCDDRRPTHHRPADWRDCERAHPAGRGRRRPRRGRRPRACATSRTRSTSPAPCADAEELLRTTDFDVACLDLGLPDGDGLDLVRRLAADAASCAGPAAIARADRPRRRRRPGRRARRRRRRLPGQAVRLRRAASPGCGRSAAAATSAARRCGSATWRSTSPPTGPGGRGAELEPDRRASSRCCATSCTTPARCCRPRTCSSTCGTPTPTRSPPRSG